MEQITYRTGNDLDLEEVIALYVASTLGERRPVGERETMRAMLDNSNLVITAWDGKHMVGIARTLTDFVYVGYLSDLAVHKEYQRRGIGVELIRLTRAAMGPSARIVLLSAPAAVEYYPRIGFTQHQSAWVLHPGQEFPVDRPDKNT
jgi:ribosomal protein S18 acetylase RimI-like enzyme